MGSSSCSDSLDSSDCSSSSSDGSEVADFSSVFGGGRFKQQCLRRYGFTSSFEQQLHRDRYTTLEGVHEAWGIVVQMLQQRAYHTDLLCRLLCVSRGLRSLVMLSCAGRLEVDFELDMCRTTKDPELQSLARFLTRQAPLIGALDISSDCASSIPFDVQEVVAVAIREAGTTLALTKLSLGNKMSLLLQQVAALASCRAGLTQLHLVQEGGLSPAEAQPLVDTLSRLTSLQSLTIMPTGLLNINNLLPGLAGLTQLTSLSAGLNRLADLRNLPASLQCLKIGAEAVMSDPQIDRRGDLLPPVEAVTLRPFTLKLAHLTALTELDCLNCYDYGQDYDEDWEIVYRGDELPPNISNLRAAVMHGAALAVLQPLSNLTFLELRHAGTTASHLRCLTVLSSLQTLEVQESKPPLPPSSDSEDDDVEEQLRLDSPDAYCEAWPLFPIKQISLHCKLTPLALQQLGSVTGLTNLTLRVARGSSVTREQLGAALRPLQRLQQLELLGNEGGVERIGDFLSSAHSPQWVTALGSGSSLTSLKVKDLLLPRASMDCMPLQHHTGLKQLELSGCKLDDYGVSRIAARVTGLHKLTLSDNRGVTDAAVREVASHLQQLRYLDVQHTGVTDASVEWLSALQQLSCVQLCGPMITESQWEGMNEGLWYRVYTACRSRDCPRSRYNKG